MLTLSIRSRSISAIVTDYSVLFRIKVDIGVDYYIPVKVVIGTIFSFTEMGHCSIHSAHMIAGPAVLQFEFLVPIRVLETYVDVLCRGDRRNG